ncbi:MAG TPA: AEC family transporter [Gaiellaceae bacterium]|nr:AEC family transporter [Gaiellaceae bacterium]
MLEIALLVAFFAVGLASQRIPWAEKLRERSWTAYFWTITPALVFYAFSTVGVDRELALALGAAVGASWLVLGISYAYSVVVSHVRDERGALTLAAGFPNTGFVGFPLAQIALGNPGLALMVVYDRLAWLVPATAVSTTIARLHGNRDAGKRGRRRLWLLAGNPPLLAALLAVGLRLGGVDVGGVAEQLGRIAGAVVGPAGFFLLGLALPLERPSHDLAELRRVSGVLAIRFGIAPLALYALGQAVGAEIPSAFLLGAAMPSAFHLLILARVFDLRPHLMRLLVLGSTVPAVAAVVAASAMLR